MEKIKTTPGTIDEYIKTFPKDVREKLQGLRRTIHAAAPGAEETIGYGIPTFDLKGHLVHFAAYANHIGFYPASSGIRAFRKELSSYKTSAGTVQIPIDKPLPLALIRKIVRFRVAENTKLSREKLKRIKP
ncbi:MAG: DUF1801 domain-containing protein [Acidobacteria bacterium]|nr:DUF1801 domain-containing protein [Acidobacteriota bacterium]